MTQSFIQMIQIIENQWNRSKCNLIYYFWYSRFPLIKLITSLVPYHLDTTRPSRYLTERIWTRDIIFRYKCGVEVEIADVVDETIGDEIVDEMVDNMLNEIPTTNMITPTTTTGTTAEDEYDSYTYEDSNIELPDTVKTFMGDAAEKLGLDTSKEDWLSSLLNGPSVDNNAEDENEAPSEETGNESENELTLVNMLT